jgi:hypothetical protein
MRPRITSEIVCLLRDRDLFLCVVRGPERDKIRADTHAMPLRAISPCIRGPPANGETSHYKAVPANCNRPPALIFPSPPWVRFAHWRDTPDTRIGP